jgi:hypothetical protein
MRLWRGRRSLAVGAEDEEAGLWGGVKISESGPALLMSKVPIRRVSPSSSSTSEGAWMALYVDDASRPANW